MEGGSCWLRKAARRRPATTKTTANVATKGDRARAMPISDDAGKLSAAGRPRRRAAEVGIVGAAGPARAHRGRSRRRSRSGRFELGRDRFG